MAGPVSAEEHPDHYRHDSGISVSWAWHEAPRQNVPLPDQVHRPRSAGRRRGATGVGLMLVTLYVTTTVTRDEAQAVAVAAAEASRIPHRRLWGSQSAGFATTLPCGTCPAE
ncbi:hypothetical protein GCM10027161_28180 [Microbispora hainanensis]